MTGLIRINRFRQGIGSLEVNYIRSRFSFPYIKYSFSTYIKLLCYVTVTYTSSFQGNDWSCFVLDAILLEAMSIDDRNNRRYVCIRRALLCKKSTIFVDPLIFGINYRSGQIFMRHPVYINKYIYIYICMHVLR